MALKLISAVYFNILSSSLLPKLMRTLVQSTEDVRKKIGSFLPAELNLSLGSEPYISPVPAVPPATFPL